MKLSAFQPFYLLFFLFAALVLNACKSTEKAIVEKPLKERDTDFLFQQMNENEFDFEWLSAKVNVQLNSGKKKTNLNARLRMKKDSIIWVSISPALGIEAARAYITRDTLIFMDRFNSAYFIGNYDYLNTLLDTEIDFEMLESLITGNNFTFYDVKMFQSNIDKNRYMISTLGRRKLKREIKKADSVNLVLQHIWLDGITYKITQMNLKDVKSNKKLQSTYSNFTEIGEQLFPTEVEVVAKAGGQVQLSLGYSRVEVGEELRFPMRIPDKYKPLNPESYKLDLDEKQGN